MVDNSCNVDEQILSNGKYKSIEHRSVVQKDRSRMSWAMFCGPAPDIVVSPRTELINEEHPPLYQGVSFGEYSMKFFKKGLDGKDLVHGLKVQADCHSKKGSI